MTEELDCTTCRETVAFEEVADGEWACVACGEAIFLDPPTQRPVLVSVPLPRSGAGDRTEHTQHVA